MNQSAIRLFVRSLITEAKEEKAAKLPKSSGKLMDLKKELAALEQMKEEIQAAKFAEKTAETEVEFANLSKFAKELDKIKAGGVALEASIDAKIEELKDKIETQKNKIKEMIGMTPAPGQEKMVDEKKEKKADLEEGQIIVIKKDFTLDGKDFKKGQRVSTQPDFDKIEAAGKAGKIKQGEDFGMGIGNMEEARFKKGTDIGKPGKGFEKIAKSAAKQYGSKEAGKKVAGAILKKVVKKKDKLKEELAKGGDFDYTNNFEEWENTMKARFPKMTSTEGTRKEDERGGIDYSWGNRSYGSWRPYWPYKNFGKEYLGAVSAQPEFKSGPWDPGYSSTGYHGD